MENNEEIILPTVQDWRDDIIETIRANVQALKTDNDKVPYFDVAFNPYEQKIDANIGSINTPYYLYYQRGVSELQGRNDYGYASEQLDTFGGTRTVDFSVYICFPNIQYPLYKKMKDINYRVRELNLKLGNIPLNSSVNLVQIIGEEYHTDNIRLFVECKYSVQVMESYMPLGQQEYTLARADTKLKKE